ncbi:FAD-dependent oxidoreductase family protein [Actinidia rufa]|uniref:FAD-dependent oxidoreductase family protein n=1 Tax=Actinidia rufa TaxID=165716 RepID=A0A7J0EJY0_9ERIC|nr:FAD-dependent oxidoreductase family protein [Actinidia rufa]
MLVTSPFLFPVPSLGQIRHSRTSTVISIRLSSSSSPVSYMEDDQRKRVVVCGGGVIGVCTAYFLAKKGAAVTLLEQSSVACAASGKAGGFLALDWCDGGPLSALARASFNLHRSLAQDLDGPQSYGYRLLTAVSLSITESQTPHHRQNHIPTLPNWVDGPARNPRIIGTTETTAQVHPQLFTRTLLSKAVADGGVEVLIGKLESVEVEGGEATAVVVEGGRRIGADAVILALGPWSGKLSILSSIFRVYGLKAHSIVLEPKEAGAISPHALFLSYRMAQGGEAMDPEVYPRPTGEVYICGMSAQVEVPDDPEQVVGNPESIAVLKRVAETVSSHLGEGEAVVKAEQACFLPCTDDSVPVIGEVPGVKGCYVATGHSCWGILNGPATGAAVAELVLDGRASIVDLSPFSPTRFIGGRKRWM